MKAFIVVLVCFAAMANAQVAFRPRISPQLCHPDDIQCHLNPSAWPTNKEQVGDYTVDYSKSLRSREILIQTIEKLVSWIVNQVVEYFLKDESLLRMQLRNKPPRRICDPKDTECNKLYSKFLPLFPPIPISILGY
uniref:Uncharacterized protein n=1 Tax=Anopheles funestus TaxID=62324 RepID=A0A182S0Y7_ANOFN